MSNRFSYHQITSISTIVTAQGTSLFPPPPKPTRPNTDFFWHWRGYHGLPPDNCELCPDNCDCGSGGPITSWREGFFPIFVPIPQVKNLTTSGNLLFLLFIYSF